MTRIPQMTPDGVRCILAQLDISTAECVLVSMNSQMTERKKMPDGRDICMMAETKYIWKGADIALEKLTDDIIIHARDITVRWANSSVMIHEHRTEVALRGYKIFPLKFEDFPDSLPCKVELLFH